MKPTAQLTPVQVDLPFSPRQRLATVSATCARDAIGTVYCWGSTVDQSDNIIFNATPVAMGIADALSLGGSCATRALGVVSCWGFNGSGQIGDGSTTDRAAPGNVTGCPW